MSSPNEEQMQQIFIAGDGHRSPEAVLAQRMIVDRLTWRTVDL